jgi:hypothetical protein
VMLICCGQRSLKDVRYCPPLRDQDSCGIFWNLKHFSPGILLCPVVLKPLPGPDKQGRAAELGSWKEWGCGAAGQRWACRLCSFCL